MCTKCIESPVLSVAVGREWVGSGDEGKVRFMEDIKGPIVFDLLLAFVAWTVWSQTFAVQLVHLGG